MRLPGRLRASTLGDLLGRLHRARISGVLELREAGGPTAGRVHRVLLRGGLVASVETEAPRDGRDGPPTLREIPIEPMSREEVLSRMDAIYALDDAELAFHVVTRAPTPLAAPLPPQDFLHGRPRARDRALPEAAPEIVRRRRALSTLGLPADATKEDVQRAFRMLAMRVHPDRHPGAEAHEREALSSHFARLAQAYHTLVA